MKEEGGGGRKEEGGRRRRINSRISSTHFADFYFEAPKAMLAVNSCLLLEEIAENGGGGAFPSSDCKDLLLPPPPLPICPIIQFPFPSQTPLPSICWPKQMCFSEGEKSSASLPPFFLVIFNLFGSGKKPFGPKKLFLALQKAKSLKKEEEEEKAED
jgi:hypothetical protein